MTFLIKESALRFSNRAPQHGVLHEVSQNTVSYLTWPILSLILPSITFDIQFTCFSCSSVQHSGQGDEKLFYKKLHKNACVLGITVRINWESFIT